MMSNANDLAGGDDIDFVCRKNGLYCVNSWNNNDKLMAQVSSVDLRLVFCVWCDTAAVLGCCKSSDARMFT